MGHYVGPHVTQSYSTGHPRELPHCQPSSSAHVSGAVAGRAVEHTPDIFSFEL